MSLKCRIFPLVLLLAACGSEEQALPEPENVLKPPPVAAVEPDEPVSQPVSQNQEQIQKLQQEIEQLQKSIAEFKHEHAELALELEIASDLLIRSENELQRQEAMVEQLETSP